MNYKDHAMVRERFEQEEKKDALGYHREDYIKWLEENLRPYLIAEDSDYRSEYCKGCPLERKLLPCHPPRCQKYDAEKGKPK